MASILIQPTSYERRLIRNRNIQEILKIFNRNKELTMRDIIEQYSKRTGARRYVLELLRCGVIEIVKTDVRKTYKWSEFSPQSIPVYSIIDNKRFVMCMEETQTEIDKSLAYLEG